MRRITLRLLLIHIVITLLLALSAPVKLLPVTSAQASASIARQGNDDEIVVGKPVERELAGNAAHNYRLRVEAGQYLQLLVEQRGIDVVVSLFDADGKKLTEIDSPNGTQGPEPLAILVEQTGTYRLEVRSLEKDAPAGRYEVKIVAQRLATPQDKQQIAAERLTAEADQLYTQNTAESRRKALAKYEQALALWKELSDASRQGTVLNRLGEIEYYFGNPQAALQRFLLALPLMQAANHRPGQADVLSNLGAAYAGLSQNQKAIDYLLQALALEKSLGNKRGEATITSNLGTLYKRLGERKAALAYFEQAAQTQEAINDDRGRAETLNGIGTIYHDSGEMQKALTYYQNALLLMQKTGNRNGEASVLNNLGRIYNDLSENRQSLDNFAKALRISKVIGNRSMEAYTVNNTGGAYLYMGEPEKALQQFSAAQTIFKDLGDRRAEAYAIVNIAGIHEVLGDTEKAISLFEQAGELLKGSGDAFAEVGILHNLGKCYYNLDRKAEAVTHFEAARSVAKTKGFRRLEAYSTGQLGAIASARGDRQQALAYFDQSLQLCRNVSDRIEEANTLCAIGDTYQSLGELPKSLEAFQQALAISREIESYSGVAWALSGIASVEQQRGNVAAAQAHLEEAIALIEQQRLKASSQDIRAAYFSTVQSYYQQYIALLMQRHKQEPAKGYEAQALTVSERARARSLLDLLSDAHATVRQGVDAGLLAEKLALQQLLKVKLNEKAILLRSKPTKAQEAEAGKEIAALQTQDRELDARIRNTSPRYAALTQPQPIRLPEIQRLLDADTMLVEYSLGKTHSYLWAVTPTTIQAFALPKRDEVEKLARQVHEFLTARNLCIKEETDNQKAARIARADTDYPQAAAALSQMLLGPLAHQLGSKRLLIVADGFLHYIPFAALPAPTGKLTSKDSRLQTPDARLPLMVEHDIVNLPSASALAAIRRGAANRQPAAKLAAVLADPVFRGDDSRFDSLPRDRANLPPDKPPAPAVTTFRATACQSGQFIKRLTYSRREALAIEALVGKSRCKLMLDFDANYENAISPDLRDYRIIHFSTHGIFNSKQPELSGILLSLVDEQGAAKNNALLRLGEVYNLQLAAELIVLSACDTALGKDVKGEGLIGLTQGFLYAGAGRVLASLWQVDDKATSELMKKVYTGMLTGKLSPARALQKAQKELWSSREWRLPYYWAAFILQGESK